MNKDPKTLYLSGLISEERLYESQEPISKNMKAEDFDKIYEKLGGVGEDLKKLTWGWSVAKRHFLSDQIKSIYDIPKPAPIVVAVPMNELEGWQRRIERLIEKLSVIKDDISAGGVDSWNYQ